MPSENGCRLVARLAAAFDGSVPSFGRVVRGPVTLEELASRTREQGAARELQRLRSCVELTKELVREGNSGLHGESITGDTGAVNGLTSWVSLPDESWRNLDAGRKELLLPLEDERGLREAT